MKKIIIALLMLASIQSHGVQLSTDGTGQVLIFPYYTVNNGYNSLLTITNTSSRAKALRVRFREAANSREIFTFNLYLGGNDEWVAGLIKTATETVQLITPDTSCTVPKLHNQENFFNNSQYSGDMADAYGLNDFRMFEGFVEVIEMGVLTGNSELATSLLATGNQSPFNCDYLVNAWDSNHADNYWIQDATTDLIPPLGEISGDLTLINVANGIAMNVKPTVIEELSDEVLHFDTLNDSPSLADGMRFSRLHDDVGRTINTTWDTGIQALSAVLMKNELVNEYEVNASFGANTTLITTLPTKQYFTDPNYSEQTPLAPFTSAMRTGNIIQQSCEEYNNYNIYSRESETPSIPSHQLPTDPPITPDIVGMHCFTVNSSPVELETSNFNDLIFDSNYVVTHPIGTTSIPNPITTPFHSGWNQSSFYSDKMMVNDTTIIFGLPIIGFSAQIYTNGALAGGTLANYGAIAESRSIRQQVYSSTTPSYNGMHLNDTGQVLIYPYYTVKNGTNTLLSVVNTSEDVKALRIKFREGKNARNVLDFNIYIGPYDVWTAQLKAFDSTVAGHVGEPSVLLQTSDTSCLMPNSVSLPSGQEFLPFGYENPYDDKGLSLSRVQEGFVEIIEMGTLTGLDAQAATHIAGIPGSCSDLQENWFEGGKWFDSPNEGIRAPEGSGGLYGSVNLISVAKGTNMKYNATAIFGYSTEAQHSGPGSEIPNLSSGSETASSLINPINGEVVTTQWNSALDAVSSLFMHDTTSNTYDVDPFAAAQTDWVSMSPTRHFYTDPIYNTANPRAPYSEGLSTDNGYCQEFDFIAFNREQQDNYFDGPIPSPVPPGNYDKKHCNAINISYANTIGNSQQASSLFESNLLIEDWITFLGNRSMYQLDDTQGHYKKTFSSEFFNQQSFLQGQGPNNAVHRIYGKPTIGFMAQKYVNGKLSNGVLANYSVIKEDTTTQKIEISIPGQ